MRTETLQNCLTNVIDNRGVTPHKRGCEWQNEGVRVLSANNVKSDGLINESDIRCIPEDKYDSWMKTPLVRGNLILTSEAPSGEVYYWDSDEKIVLGQRLYGLQVNEKVVDPKYLKYFIQSEYGHKIITNQNSGSTVFGIAASTFPHIKITMIDSVDEQRKVGNLLYDIDSKITLNKSICSELEAILEEIYNFWFVQFDFPDENGKPYKSSGGKMVWNEKLKIEIPEGWRVNTLKGKYNIDRGLAYSSNDIESGYGVAMINLACVDRNRNYRDGELKYYDGNISEEDYVKPNDLLIACTDLTRDRDIIGCPILVPNDGIDYTFSMDIAKISFDDDFEDMYMYMALRTKFYHNYIKEWASGTNVLHLNLDGLDWYSMVIPPKPLQEAMAKFVVDIHNQKSIILAENRELTKLRDYLLPMLMNGQIKV